MITVNTIFIGIVIIIVFLVIGGVIFLFIISKDKRKHKIYHKHYAKYYGDKVAGKTEWTMMDSYTQHNFKLVRESIHYMKGITEFKDKILWGLLTSFGVILSPIFINSIIQKEISMATLFALPISIGAIIVGLIYLIPSFRSFSFDKEAGYFWQGNFDETKAEKKIKKKKMTKLEDIHALQLLSHRYQRGDKFGFGGWFWEYELNMILHDGQRLSVLRTQKENIHELALEIAKFLAVSLWNEDERKAKKKERKARCFARQYFNKLIPKQDKSKEIP